MCEFSKVLHDSNRTSFPLHSKIFYTNLHGLSTPPPLTSVTILPGVKGFMQYESSNERTFTANVNFLYPLYATGREGIFG